MPMVRVAAVVQARTTSQRLPGKVLTDLAGKPVLAHVVQRVRAAALVDKVVVATTANATDDDVAELACDLGVEAFRGDEADVLSRFTAIVSHHRPDVVVRVTGDCPLLDPEIVDLVVQRLLDDPTLDYSSNTAPRTYPRGLDVEAVRSSSLLRAGDLATTTEEREHVTFGIHTVHADLFRRTSVASDVDDSDLRWTVDYPEDLQVLRMAAEALGLDHDVPPYRQVVQWFRHHPEVAALNSHRATWTP